MIHSFEEAAKVNAAHGGRFFEPSKLTWRNANLLNIYPTKGGAFFSLSERNGRKPRAYSVLYVSEDTGQVTVWGVAGQYRTTSAASDRAQREADKWSEGCGLCDSGHSFDKPCPAIKD